MDKGDSGLQIELQPLVVTEVGEAQVSEVNGWDQVRFKYEAGGDCSIGPRERGLGVHGAHAIISSHEYADDPDTG